MAKRSFWGQTKRKILNEISNDNAWTSSSGNPSDTQPQRKRSTRQAVRSAIRNRPPVERVEEDFGHTVFPNEIWDKIFCYLSKRELRVVTYVCKNLRCIANTILWDAPRFKECIGAAHFKSLTHLPICKLSTCDLKIRKSKKAAAWFMDIFSEMTHLKEIEVTWTKKGPGEDTISMEALRCISPFITLIHTDAVNCENRREYAAQLASIDFPKLQSVVVNISRRRIRGSHLYTYSFTLEDLETLNKLPITSVSIGSLQPTAFPQVTFFSKMKSLKTVLLYSWNWIDLMDLNSTEIDLLKELQCNGVAVFCDGEFVKGDLLKELLCSGVAEFKNQDVIW